jgi:hypothetical protein
VIKYLLSALHTTECLDKIIEIGGADVITYKQMILGYAKVRGLKRRMIPVPVLTPSLSSYWVHLVTPITCYKYVVPLALRECRNGFSIILLT